jgi:hypothetical protein
MKTLQMIKRIVVSGAVMLTMGLALTPRAEASTQTTVSAERFAIDPFMGGGKDGNETHG